MTLLYLVIAWFCGLTAGSFLNFSPTGWLVVGGTFALLSYHFNPHKRLLVAGLFIILGAGGSRYTVAHTQDPQDQIAFYVERGENLHLSGEVVSPEDGAKELQVSAINLEHKGQWKRLSGDILIVSNFGMRYAYGDRLELWGELKAVPEFNDFAYREKLNREGVYGVIYRPDVIKVKKGEGNPFLQKVFLLRNQGDRQLNNTIPSPESDLVKAIVLGEKKEIKPEMTNLFNQAGVSHLLTISSKNLTILAALMGGLIPIRLRSRWRGMTMICAGGGIIFYALLMGGKGSIIAAGIFTFLSLLALQWRLPFDPLSGLASSAFILTVWKPDLAWEPGFQLSLGAMCGLILLKKPLEKLFRKVRERITEMIKQAIRHWYPSLVRRWERRFQKDSWGAKAGNKVKAFLIYLEESVATTFAAQSLIFPLLLYYFKQISFIAPLSDIVTLPILPWLILAGYLTVTGGLIHPLLGALFSWPTWLISSALISIVHLLSRVPFASWMVPAPPLWLIVFFYSAVFLTWLYFIQKKSA